MSKKSILLLIGSAVAMNAGAAERVVAVSSAELNVTKAQTDVLGRHNSKVRYTPQNFVKTQKSKVLAKAADYPSEESIAKTYGAFEHRNGKRWYAFNTEEGLSESQYISRINNVEDNDQARAKFIRENKKNYDKLMDESLYRVSFASDPCSGKESCVRSMPTHSDKYSITQYEDIDFLNYSSVLKKSNLNASVIGSNITGKNIGISFTEVALPLQGYGANYRLEANCYINYPKSRPSDIVHGTHTAKVLSHVAPGATLYGLQSLCDGKVALPVDGYNRSPKIYIGNHSYGSAGTDYDENESKYIDDFIYNTRTIEFGSAGNCGTSTGTSYSCRSNAHISQVARAVNVIAVGAVHNDLTYHKTSSNVNPWYPKSNAIKYVKPEIANFSDLLFPNDGVAFIEQRNGDNWVGGAVLTPYFLMTSSSSPYTAASVALLLDRFPFYKWHPEVVKALLITSSVKKIINAEQHDADNVEYKVAMGVPDGRTMFEKNRSKFWNGNNGDFFKNKKISFTETGIQSGRKYRIAIAWLSSGTAVAQYGRLPQDINLKVKQNGRTIARSESTSNPFEVVDITTENSGDLEIIIERKEGNGENLGGRVLLGYNFLELPDAYQRR